MTSTLQEADEGSGPDPQAEGLPCSAAQLRFYFLQTFQPTDTSLNVAMRWKIKGRISEHAIDKAVRTLVARHEILRTGFSQIDGEPRQFIRSEVDFKLLAINFSRLDIDAARDRTETFGIEEARRPFDLAAAPLFRATLVRLSPTEAILHFTFHHIVVDGWSIGVLMRELTALAFGGESGDVLKELELQYADYALWQREMLDSGSLDEARRYWLQKLAGVPRFEAPGQRPRPAVRTTRSFIRTRLIARDVGEQVQSLASGLNETLFTTACAALGASLASIAPGPEVVLGTQVAGRRDVALETVVGPFVNSLVLRYPIFRETDTFASLLQRVGVTVREALSNDLPFENIVEMHNPPRDQSRTPLYSINFTLQTANVDTGTLESYRGDNIRIDPIPSKAAGALWDLSFFMVGREEGWRISCEANSDMYDEAAVDGMLAEWERVMGAAAASAGRSPVMSRRSPTDATLSSRDGAAESTAAAVGASTVEADKAALAAQLLTIWKQVLRKKPIDVNSDFFDAGGHSLLAMRLVAKINKELGTDVDVQTFFRNSTPVALANALIAKSTPAVADPHDERRPATIVALNNGSAFALVERRLDPARRFIDVSIDFIRDYPEASMDELSAMAAEQIRAAVPNGPYVLLGYCTSGIMAFEAARSLVQHGEEVRSVVMIDSASPDFERDLSWLGRLRRIAPAFFTTIKNFRLLCSMLRRDEISAGVFIEHFGFMRKLRVAEFLAKLGLIDPVPRASGTVLGFDVTDNILAARARTAAAPYEGDILLFLSEEVVRSRWIDKARGWKKLTSGNVKVVDVSGGHGEVTRDPAASEIAQELEALLGPLQPVDRGS